LSTKYIYYFRGTLTSHVHLFEAWVHALRAKNIPFELVTDLNIKDYYKQRHLISKYRSNYFHIYPSLSSSLFQYIYFTSLCLFNDKVVIHLKKRPTKIFEQLKKIFPKKIRYVIEHEGDAISEHDYLCKHIYKNGFYHEILCNLAAESATQKRSLIESDHNTVGTDTFKNLLCDRYPDEQLGSKISVVPMTFNKGALYFSENKRLALRSKLNVEGKFVMIYIGNALYSWQNLFRTIEIFTLLKKKMVKDAYLILLIRKADHHIAKEFISDLGLSEDDYLLSHVAHEMVIEYLAAADLGVALRHDHIMNMIAYSGKILDYLGCGLPVLTTIHNGEKIPLMIKNNGFGLVLNDMDDDEEILRGVPEILAIDSQKRTEISDWANRTLSFENYIDNYANCLLDL
jgi:glycosyltransferase involved in cell wall biosynthesis